MSFSLRLRSRPRRTQPKEVVGFGGFGRPAFAVVCSDGVIDYANNNVGAFTAAAKLSVISGAEKGLLFPSGSCYGALPTRPQYNLLGPITLVWVGVIDTLAQYQFLIARALGNGSVNNPFEFRVNGGGGMNLIRSNASAYASWSTASSPPVGVPTVLAVTNNGNLGDSNATRMFINGIYQTQSTSTTASGSATGNSEYLLLGTRSDTYSYMRGACMAAIGFSRILSDAEIKAISANPWSVFAP